MSRIPFAYSNDGKLCSSAVPILASCAALDVGWELVVLVFEQDVERGQRSVGRCMNRNS